jgi:hypothetical protein
LNHFQPSVARRPCAIECLFPSRGSTGYRAKSSACPPRFCKTNSLPRPHGSTFPVLSFRPVFIIQRVHICTVVLSGTFRRDLVIVRYRIPTFRRACWHLRTRSPRSLLRTMTAAGNVQGAQSDRSIHPCQLRRGRARYQVRRQCGHRRWMSIPSSRGSRDRAAEPSCGRMQTTRGARRWERLGGREECGRPLQVTVSYQAIMQS